MIKVILYSTLSLISFTSIGQINELKKASDQAEQKISNRKTLNRLEVDYAQFANPFIGTGGHGHTYPGATYPFGMMQLSPDTRFEGWDGCSGYHYSDSIIYGFSHTHLNGTGVSDYGDLLIVPQSCKKPKTTPGYQDAKKGYGHRFSHSEELAAPGFYQVYLPDEKIRVRLTTTERAGLHEYTFEDDTQNKYILLDLDHRDKLLDQHFELKSKTEISGYRISSAWANEQHFYFHLVLSTPYQSATVINKDGQNKLLLEFPKTTSTLFIRVGMSGVDIDGAANNLNTEMPDFQFKKYMSAARKAWNTELSKIEIRTTDDNVKTIFYTSLYHTAIQPNLWSDVDGRYRGRDNAIHHTNSGRKQYTVFSLWDTYRATHPLYTLIQQDRTNDFIHTFLNQYDQGGDLPVWELAANETECMIGYHSTSVITDAFVKGIDDFDAEKAMLAMQATANFDELGKRQFRTNGFIDSGSEPESVSKTLEYAYDDFCIAEMARRLGKIDVYHSFYNSSFNFLNIYDPSTKFMRARRGGRWHQPFDPSEVNFNYTEANSWQYSLYTPHAIDVLSTYMGGVDSLETWLDRLFTTEMELSGRHQVDITGLIGQYAHGNEPSHHMAYLYNYTNTPHKTQQYIDRIQKEMYTALPDGLSGNEDCGQMSAWYVMSALGLYQVTPGYPWYDFGRPTINEAKVKLENGKELIFKAVNNSTENKYIEKITWNGEEWTMNQIHHSTLMEGGELVFYMQSELPRSERIPNKSALQVEDIQRFNFTPSPFVLNSERIFENETRIELGYHQSYLNEQTKIEYRFAEDTSTVNYYMSPIPINKSTTIQARRINTIPYGQNGGMPGISVSYSPWISADFIRKDPSVHLELSTEYSPQYAASGPSTLIDGVQGENEFRTGDYQGFWATDVEAKVYFDSPKEIREIGLSVLQDMKSWVFYPSEFEVLISYDGNGFESVGKFVEFPVFKEYAGPTNMNAWLPISSSEKITAFKIKVKNFGKCPDWHLGSGNDTWLFLDEILYR